MPTAASVPFPSLTELDVTNARVTCADGTVVHVGDRTGPWTLMAVVAGPDHGPVAVLEDFHDVHGPLLLCRPGAEPETLAKTAEPVTCTTRPRSTAVTG